MYPEPDQQLTFDDETGAYFFTHAYDPLNNWSAHAVDIWNHRFPTVEHAFQWRKFSEHETGIAEAILQSTSPWAALQINRSLGKDKMATNWQGMRVQVMEELLRAKAKQHKDVRECLRKTGSKPIIENSPVDDFWGCGLDGQGKNMMGVLWAKVRNEFDEQ